VAAALEVADAEGRLERLDPDPETALIDIMARVSYRKILAIG
jgi:hypothetical protein